MSEKDHEEYKKRMKEIVERVKKTKDTDSKPDGTKKDDWLECFITYLKEARIIKLADRLDNLLDMERCKFPEPRKSRYYEQSKIILRTCKGVDNNLETKLYNLVYYKIFPKINDNIILY